MLLVYNKLASAEDNGVVIHNPLALTHTFLPCRPAYPEAWRQYHMLFDPTESSSQQVLGHKYKFQIQQIYYLFRVNDLSFVVSIDLKYFVLILFIRPTNLL